ncbi:MAG: hypothetical protein K6B46_04455, partial [Opitutales bacterium]|nr:hypothetical protein [Opitutales bacterium]
MSDPDFQPRTPFPGTWVPTGNIPAGFAPEHNDTGAAADSDCDFREYSWTFDGNAAYFQNVFSAVVGTIKGNPKFHHANVYTQKCRSLRSFEWNDNVFRMCRCSLRIALFGEILRKVHCV